jgi:hypothetical protein
MKKFTLNAFLLLAIILTANLSLLAQVLPDNWTGDTDIDTFEETTEVYSGSASCKVDVLSGTQASCDMRHDEVAVTAGDTYTYSFWVWTSDHVTARVVLEWAGASITYGDYSAAGTGGFVEVSYSGTVPDGATGVKVGYRFYDQSGFVAPETQYVDEVTFESPTGTPVTLVNGGFESWPSASSIASAYAVSATAMDVVYGTSITTVSASDYSLTGTSAITFSSATIDGTNDNIVHLTGASASMTGDNVLDNISDAANATDFDFYAGIMPISYTNPTNPAGIIDNTHIATYQGIISANDAYNNTWVSDAAGERSGVMIYDSNFDGLVAVGDEVLFTATRAEYNGLSELVTPELLSTISTGNDPYGPATIDGSDIDETITVDTDPAEKWEGQLVTISDFTVESYTDYDYRCSWSDGSTTYYFHVGDNVVYQLSGISMTVGDTYGSITGVIDWDNSDSYYRINPRGQSDIVEASSNTFIVGSFNGWTGNDPAYEMTWNANGLLELTKNLPAGDNEYKVVQDGNWYPGDNQHIILASAADTTWKYNPTAHLVTHTLPVVAGDFVSELGGTDWDPTDLTGEMEDPDGDEIYTLEVLIPAAGSFECKVTLNNNWNQSTGGNTPFTTDGINPTVFTYDFPNNVTTVSGPPPPAATVTFTVNDSFGKNYDGFYLKGSWDANGYYDPNWGNGAEHSMFYDDGTNGDLVAGDHIWTCEQELTSDGGSNTWEWGINDVNHNWVAGNWTFQVIDGTPFELSWDVPDEPALVINEIMYNSIGTDEEWIELYNNTGSTIDLENWRVIDSDPTHPSIVIPAGYSVDAGGYFTISIETGGSFPFTPDYDGTGNFALNNSGDDVYLYNGSGILVDLVSYSDSDPWPTEPDGDGPSLSLISPDLDNSLAESWDASREDGGTPGAENFPPLPYVEIITPDGGEILEKGMPYDITWEYDLWDGNIQIDLLKEGGEPQLIVYNIPLADGSYTWNVWNELPDGNDYKILITGLESEDPSDESDNNFSIIEPYIIPDIVITEIMYNPPEAGDDSLEFLEFYNNTLETVNLEGYFMSNGIEYTFPNIDILPDTFMLLAKDSVAMLNTFGVVSYQWTGGALSNGGEAVELSDFYGNVIDYVAYSDQMPWDTLADGHGPSLTLCNPDSDNSKPGNWTASVNLAAINSEGDSIWATPGFECQLSIFAGFEGVPTFVNVGDSVMFTDETVGDPTTWMWTFEGGTPETFEGQTPPYIVYNTEGLWDVTLYVSDGVNSDEITYEDYIQVVYHPAPTNLQAEVGPFDDVQLTWSEQAPTEFADDFESYEDFVIEFMPWTNIDVDGSTTYGMTDIDWPNAYDPQSFIIFNPSQTIPAVEDVIPHSGDKLAACFAATTPPNNDWMIAPMIKIVDGASLDFWAKSYTDQYGLERFKIGVSTTGMDPADFTIISEGEYVEVPADDWTEFNYDLSAYAGQNVYVGIQCVSNDAFILLVDDVTIGVMDSKIVYNHPQPVIGKVEKTISYTTKPNSVPSETYRSERSVLTEVLGYNVYRDNTQINDELVLETSYNDADPSIGTHDYYVTALYETGESEPSNVVSVVVTDINEISTNSVTVYPNPTDGIFTIRFTENVSVDLSLIDLTGKKVFAKTVTETSSFNVSELQSGIYFLRILDKSSNTIDIKKLIIR